MNNLINGKEIASKRQALLTEKIAKLPSPLSLVSLLIGDNPASLLYTDLKRKKATELGITFTPLTFPDTTPFEEVINKIKQLNEDPTIDGIMIQLPLPQTFLTAHQSTDLTDLISPQKDIDGLSSKRLVPPAAVKAVLSLLEEEYITVFDMPVVVIGTSDLVGKPLAEEFQKLGAHVSVIDINTENPAEITKRASLIVTAVGKPNLLTGDMVSEGVVVIDVGTLVIPDQNNQHQKKVIGDVDFESVAPKAKKITPVPGGVGPLTIIALFENSLELKTNLKFEI